MKSFLFSFFFLIKETNIFCFALMSVVALAALVVFFAVAVAVVVNVDVVAVDYDCSNIFSLVLFLIAEANSAHY